MMNLATAPIIERMGWMLVHSIWLLAIPAALFGCFLWLTPQSYSRLRYAVGIAVLAIMAVLPIVSAAFTDVSVKSVAATNEGKSDVQESFDREFDESHGTESIERADANVANDDVLQTVGDAQRRTAPIPAADAAGDAVVVQPNQSYADEEARTSLDQTNMALSDDDGESTAFVRFGVRLKPFLPWAVAGWMVGVLLMSLRLLLGWRSTRRLKRQGVQPVPDAIEALFAELKQRIGGCKAARLVQSTLVSVPSIVGHFRPVVLLPVSAVTGLSEEQLRAILAHELAHVKRHDYLLNLCQTVIETLLFYHPAVWWVSHCVREERENCCDDVALRIGCQASELARALVTVDAIRPPSGQESIDSALIPAADGGSLLRRVRRLAGGTADKHVVGRSWIAGGFALGLTVAMWLTSLASIESVAQESGSQDSNAEETQEAKPAEAETQRAASDDGRINFADGYYVELAAVADLPRPETDTVVATAWRISGSAIDEPPFYGTQVRPGLTIGKDQVARKFYVRARMPSDTKVDLDVGGMKASGSTVRPAVDSSNVEIEADTIAVLSEDREAVDLTVNLQLPAWRTLALFDFAGGVKNGIIMDRERKVSEFSRYTATGKFGPNATKENIRIIAFDRQHQQLEVAEARSGETDGKLTELDVAFKNGEGRPGYIVVQRRIESRPIVFRDVPLSPGKKSDLKITIFGVDEDATSSTSHDSSLRPLKTLLTEPFEPLAAQVPGAGTMRLISVRVAETDSPGWHADGSPRLVPFRDEELQRLLPRRETDGDYRELEVFFEFVASSSDTRVGRVRVQPLDGLGTATRKPIEQGDKGRSGVRLLRGLKILDDRETGDFKVDVFAGPLHTLTTLPIVDPPDDAEQSRLRNDPDPAEKGIAFLIRDPKESKAGSRHSVSVILSEEVPQGVVLTGITSDGERMDGFVNSARDRKIVGSFYAPAGQRLESVEIATQPQHSMVFRNVSVWSGLGSSAFVDQSEPAAIDFNSVTPSRVFLLPSGERIAEQDGQGVGVSPALAALDEIERRGGLFRFDAEAEAPTGETLPYLTEIRWRDFRAEELRWVRPLAGLKRLKLSSEFTTDESLRSIEHLTSLEEIEISQSRYLTTSCLKSIGKLTELRELQLVSSLRWNEDGYDPEDFKHLKPLTKIVEWEPYDWRMDDAGIAWLDDAEDLNLIFGWGPEITDDGFAALAGKPNLGVIRLGTTKITDASLALLENHPELYWLQCSSPNLTDNVIDSVITMSNLRDLHLQESQVTDRGVQKLIDALDKLPRLEKVNLIDTKVSQTMVQQLRAAREGLRVFASEPTKAEETKPSDEEDAKEAIDPPENTANENGNENQDGQVNPKPSVEDSAATAAPKNVPWPDKKWTKELPPSGSGIRVKLNDRRWVELNSIYATQKVDDQRFRVRWKPDGELIDPLADFDPRSLVPDREGNEMPSVTRGFVMQIVGPKGTQFTLDTSGGVGYGKPEYPLGDEFVQIAFDAIASSIGYNHAFAEVKVSREKTETIALNDSRIQVLSDPEERKVFVITPKAKDFAWRLMIRRDDEVVGVEPYLVGGNAGRNRFLSEELKSDLKEESRESPLLGFSFDKDQPMPELVELERSPYDTVRFDNLSVYPGPRTAVVVSVNGVPIDEKNRPEISPIEDAELNNLNPETRSDDDFDTVTLTGTVVDENGFGIRDCWVGLFIEPQERYGQSARSPPWAKQPLSAFGEGPPLTAEAKTDALGRFSFEAPKTHFVFEGQLWAMRPDGTLGTIWLNAVWSHVRQPENLKITVRDDEATVRVIDQNDDPVSDAVVTLQAFRKLRGVTQRVPEAVQQRVKITTDDSGRVSFGGMKTPALRGVQVRADSFGTQFLSDHLASKWVDDGEPLTLKLQPTASLSGQVIDFDPGLDAGLQLLARTEQHDDRPPMYGRGIATVRPDGTFKFDRLAAGRVTLDSSLSPDSGRKIRFEYIPSLEAGEDRILDADQNPRMVPAVLVRQRLIKSDTGEGIPNSLLSVLWGDAANRRGSRQRQVVTTDANGWWMARVLPGTINIRLHSLPDGYRSKSWFDGRYARGGVKATVPATEKLVTLPPERYVPAVELAGRLQFADDSPAAEWSVNGHPVSWDDLGLGAVRTDQDGFFTLTYPTGYPPRLFRASNRQWMTEHDFTDRYIVPKVDSKDPLVLQIPETQARKSD